MSRRLSGGIDRTPSRAAAERRFGPRPTRSSSSIHAIGSSPAMWQVDWGVAPPDLVRSNDSLATSAIDPATVEAACTLFWEEHCVECAYPTCYTTCPLFVARPDQKCARFRYGIFPNQDYQGLFGYGADVAFRRWGKARDGAGNGRRSRRRAAETGPPGHDDAEPRASRCRAAGRG